MTQPGQGEDAGQLDVQVVADLRGFVKDLRTKVNAAAEKVKAKVQVQVKTAGLRTELRNAVKEAAAKSKVVASVGVKITAAELRRAVKEAAAKAKAKAQIAVQVSATQLRRQVAEAAAKAKPKVRVDADTKPARRAIEGLNKVKAVVKADTKDFTAKLGQAAKSALSFGLIAAKGLGLAVVAAGAAAGAANLLSFAAAAATAVQSAGLLPAVLGAYVGILATTKLALSGVGDAISESFNAYSKLAAGTKLTAAEQEKLNQSLAKLSPNARAFVVEVSKLAPAFDSLRLDVQEKFFKGLGTAVRDLAATYLPTLKTGLGDISASINGGLLQSLTWLNDAANASLLPTILANTSSAAWDLFAALGPIGSALLQVAEVGSNFLPGLASGLSEWATGFADAVGAAAADGRLHQWISDGLSMLGQLVTMGQNVVGILKGVFSAAEAAGGSGAFTILSQVLATLNEAANSAAGQQALIGVFTALSQIGSALAPVLTAVVGGLGPLAKIVGDLAVALSPGLTVLVQALAQGLQNLAPAAGPVGRAISDIAKAVAPLLPLIGAQLANGLTLLAGILSIVAREAGPLIGVFGQMATQVATTMLPVIQQLIAGGLGPATEAGLALAKAFMPLVPVIVTLAQTIAAQLLAHLPQLQAMLSGQLVPAIAKIAEAMGGALLDALLAIAPQIPDLIDAGLQLAQAFTELVVAIIPFLPQMIQMGLLVFQLLIWLTKAAPAISTFAGWIVFAVNSGRGFVAMLLGAAAAVGQFFSDAWGAIQSVGSSIGNFFTVTLPGWFSSLLTWFQELPGKILTFLTALPGQLATFFMFLLSQAAYWVGFGIGSIIKFFIDLPGRVMAALAALGTAVSNGVSAVVSFFQALPGRVWALVTSLWNGARNLFSAGVNAVVGFVSGLPGRISSFVSTARDRVVGAFTSMWSSARTSVSNGVSNVVSTITGLPGRLGDLSGKLVSAGRDLIRGLINGVEEMVGKLTGAIKGVVGKGIQGAKDALGIKSPSRVFMKIGHQMVQGYTIGIDQNRPSAVQAAERLAGAVTASASEANPASPTITPTGGAGDGDGGGLGALAPLVGSLTLQTTAGASVAEQLEELMFQLRVIRRGGVVAGTR